MNVDGTKIQAARKQLGFSAFWLADKAGFFLKDGTPNRDSIHKIEKRTSYKLNIHVATAIAKVLKVSLDTIRGEG